MGASNITENLRPPYYAVVFTSRRIDVDAEGYRQTAARMEELARNQPEFLAIESAREGKRPIACALPAWRPITHSPRLSESRARSQREVNFFDVAATAQQSASLEKIAGLLMSTGPSRSAASAQSLKPAVSGQRSLRESRAQTASGQPLKRIFSASSAAGSAEITSRQLEPA
jgi:hypothetical protein